MTHPFRVAIEARDIEAAAELLTEDVTFASPIAFRSYEGPERVRPILGAVASVFRDFEYVDELCSADGTRRALVFKTRIGDRWAEGCDLLEEDAAGRITKLTVMIRPLSAALALAEAMANVLAESDRHGLAS